jgi:hypothetical protein
MTTGQERDAWSLYSAAGRVCCYVAFHPSASLREIANAVRLTERQVARILRDLAQTDLIEVERSGPRAIRRIRLDAEFADPLLGSLSLGSAIAPVVQALRGRTGEAPPPIGAHPAAMTPVAESVRHYRELQQRLRRERHALRERMRHVSIRKDELLARSAALIEAGHATLARSGRRGSAVGPAQPSDQSPPAQQTP